MMMKFLASVLMSASMIFGVTSQDMAIGSQKDSHGCYLDGGYKWCHTTEKCQRPWSEPCPETHKLERCVIGFCENKDDCPKCQDGYECKGSENMICAGTCYGQCVPHRRKRANVGKTTHDIPTHDIPTDCISWYDGCNTCQVRDGQILGCTRMMCFRKGEPHCRAHSSGSH